jgi:predicted enzyme related to lactoylglutathione lyase
VQVPDVAAACVRVVELGGTVVMPKQSTPFGLDFAYVADPDGSTFGVWTPPPAAP